jgi:hypothetical protein
MGRYSKDFELEAQDLFSLTITGAKDIESRELLKNFTKSAEVRAKWAEVTSAVTNKSAQLFANRMKMYLSTTYRHKSGYAVGATGEAANNIEVEPVPQMGKTPTASTVVVEGTASKHNYWIRHGWRSAGGADRLIPMSRVREYLAEKGIVLQVPTGEQQAGGRAKYVPTTKYIKQRSRKGNVYARALKKSSNQIDVALKDLQSHMSYGSEFTHLRQLYPSGRPYFDYVAMAIRNSSDLWQEVEKISEFGIDAVIDWLSASRSSMGQRVYSYTPKTK